MISFSRDDNFKKEYNVRDESENDIDGLRKKGFQCKLEKYIHRFQKGVQYIKDFRNARDDVNS